MAKAPNHVRLKSIQDSIKKGSSCLLKVPIMEGVGEFKKRKPRQRETYGARSKRLGNLATRTSVGLSNQKAIMEKR